MIFLVGSLHLCVRIPHYYHFLKMFLCQAMFPFHLYCCRKHSACVDWAPSYLLTGLSLHRSFSPQQALVTTLRCIPSAASMSDQVERMSRKCTHLIHLRGNRQSELLFRVTTQQCVRTHLPVRNRNHFTRVIDAQSTAVAVIHQGKSENIVFAR